jgi:hypothetical protein
MGGLSFGVLDDDDDTRLGLARRPHEISMDIALHVKRLGMKELIGLYIYC